MCVYIHIDIYTGSYALRFPQDPAGIAQGSFGDPSFEFKKA